MSLPTALYHVTPLHYIPHLLMTGTLYSQTELQRHHFPIVPRQTVARRDRKLHLDNYVHLSTIPITPLLRDKLKRGYPHGILTLSIEVMGLPEAALQKYNAKAWRHRDDFQPVTDEAEKILVWSESQKGKYPSLEVIIRDQLPLKPFAHSLSFSDSWQQEWLECVCQHLNLEITIPFTNWHPAWPECCVFDREPFEQYRQECCNAGVLLPPPVLPFD